MTNEELKKKITEILEETEYEWTEEKNGYILQIFYDKLADALIAVGIGDIREAEHRAQVAERALDKATELAYEYRTQDDTLSCSSCPFDSIFDRCKERGLYEDCSKRWKEELLQQAEKELAEEGDDDSRGNDEGE